MLQWGFHSRLDGSTATSISIGSAIHFDKDAIRQL
jgi:hypothetical protein